jgi:methionyl-tRNA formyltransferase
VVVAYGKILPRSLLDIPRLGFVNLHFSLLPAYRGAAPVQRALMDGVEETGISVMILTEGMDEGPVLAVRPTAVAPDENAGELGERLAAAGAPLLVETIASYAAGAIEPSEQDHDRATYAPKISSEEARIEWERPAHAIHNLVRGLNPAPGAWTTFRGARLKVLRTIERDDRGRPGEILDGGALVVATGDTAVELVEVQPAGKRAMSGEELRRGLRPAAGEVME